MKSIGIVYFILLSSISGYTQSLSDITDLFDESVEVHWRGETRTMTRSQAKRALSSWYRDEGVSSMNHAHKLSPRGEKHAYGILHANGKQGRYRLFYLCKKKGSSSYKVVKLRITDL